MATSPVTCYCASPFAVDPLRTYRVFPSKNMTTPSSSPESSPLTDSPSLFDPRVLEPLGDFRVFSTELLFLIFEHMDFDTLGKLSTSSALLGAKIHAYFQSTSGLRRLDFLGSLHDGKNLASNLSQIHGLGLYLKRSSCLLPTRDRLPALNQFAAKLNCFTVWNYNCRKIGLGCDGLMYLGELFHTFIAGWEDAEIEVAYAFIEKNSGLRKLTERLSSAQPGNSAYIELQFRSFTKKVFLRNGQLNDRDLAFWLTLILKKHNAKAQAYFLYVILGPVGATGEGMASVRWAEMGEVTPPSPAVADEWFRPLAKALRALYKANHSWTSREVLTLMHEVTVLHGDTWLLENAACLLLECGAEMIEDLLMSRVASKKVTDIGAWIAALCVAVVHFDDRSRITVILTVLRQVLLGLGNDVASRDSLFTSIADTFQEFVVEYAELMTEDDERLGDLKKILRGQSYFQIGTMSELANHLPSRRSGRVGKVVGKVPFKVED